MSACETGYREPFTRSPWPDQVRTAVLANDAYRAVLYTDKTSRARTQQVAMAVGYGADSDHRSLGWERHADYSQAFTVIEGYAVFYSGTRSDPSVASRTVVRAGDTWVVEAGMYHELTGRFKLLTVYTPPKWPPHTYHETFADARAAEAAERRE